MTQALTRQPVGEAGSGEAARDFAAFQGRAQRKKGRHGGLVADGGGAGGKVALDCVLQLGEGHCNLSLSRDREWRIGTKDKEPANRGDGRTNFARKLARRGLKPQL